VIEFPSCLDGCVHKGIALPLFQPLDIDPQNHLKIGWIAFIARARLNIIALVRLNLALQMPYVDLTKFVDSYQRFSSVREAILIAYSALMIA